MRSKCTRFHGNRRLTSGPSLVSKNIHQLGTCMLFMDGYTEQYCRIHGINVDNLKQEPFGLPDFNVHYSLDKRKRWLIPGVMETDIEGLQRPEMKLRVSGSCHVMSQLREITGNLPEEQVESLEAQNETIIDDGSSSTFWYSCYPTTSYHDCVNDEFVHKHAQRARLRTLTFKPRPKRKAGEGKHRERFTNVNSMADQPLLEYDGGRGYPPLHVRYSVLTSARPSKGEYSARKRARKSGERRQRTICSNSKECYNSDHHEDNDIVLLEDDVQELLNVEELCQGSFQNRSYNLAHFMINRKKKKQRIKKPITRKLSTIENYRTTLSVLPITEGSGSDNKNNSATLPTPMLEDQPKADLPNVKAADISFLDWNEPGCSIDRCRGCDRDQATDPDQSCDSDQIYDWDEISDPDRTCDRTMLHLLESRGIRLPVYPTAYIVHKRDTVEVLGEKYSSCVVVRRTHGREVTMSIATIRCPECSILYLRRRDLISSARMDELPISLVDDDHLCTICYKEQSPKDLFALKCKHHFCRMCWLTFVNAKIARQQVPVPCMDQTCSHSLSALSAVALLSPDAFDVYRRLLDERRFREEFVIRCCGCSKILPRTASERIVKCSGCDAVTCAICQKREHRPLSCTTFEEYNKVLEANALSTSSSVLPTRFVSRLTKCPWCMTLMEMSFGCPRMTCRCGSVFCYHCGSAWTAWHWHCEGERFRTVVLVDHLPPSSKVRREHVHRAVTIRVMFLDLQDELVNRLRRFPISIRRRVCRTFQEAIRHLEYSVLSNSLERARKKGSYPRRARAEDQLTFAVYFLLNTNDGDANNMMRKYEFMRLVIEQNI